MGKKKERREKEKKECDVMRGVCVEIDYVRIWNISIVLQGEEYVRDSK